MKKFLVICMILFSAMTMKAQEIRMMITSDPHVMSEELFDRPYGEAFLKGMQQDLKVIEESQKLFDNFCKKVIDEHPDILLIPGDLTREGEKVSHQHMAMKLKEIRDAGVKVYVIPGNHDMENPYAKMYRGDKAETVESISTKEFSEIYHEDGYAEAVMRDSVTDSYMVYPAKGLALICLNTIIPNEYKSRYVHGRLSHRALRWVEEAATKARSEHRMVMVMMHHELMQHHDQEDYYAATAMLNQEKDKDLPPIDEVRQTFRRNGIEVVITGHYHIQSIKTMPTYYGDITDITTGCLSGFPSPYRNLTLDLAKNTLKVTSATMFGNKTSSWPNTDLAKREFDRLKYMVQLYVPRIKDVKTDMGEAYNYLAKSFDTVLCALAAGDEKNHNPRSAVDNCMKAWDEYVNHVLLYNTIKINQLKDEKDGPYQRLRDMFTSIMYNYVGKKNNDTPDNDYEIMLKVER